ncbi:ABC transporter ATP-binding protein [Deinococcus sp. MIMF12]|uniref:ABC transporter ATP-binding protein n=1 Tax=Deinococcus rhizophilus TaxID=3049544 RepID=A0ABT7JJ25_9DEIO|nr:ABC transporter ATP-binding protein [Deinococcus rhizophilus]MDL2345055.1 ABC transporter ATP-binding protein [Deinococcus rhizophilus]
MNVVEMQGVSRTYGPVTALRDLSLQVRAGELTALLGPNGAGKTTAISLMLGLSRPTSGTVRVLGEDPRHSAVRARIGAMPQESALPGALTVREAVTLFASFHAAPLGVGQALALAGLEDRANRRAGRLSGGERRRLAFALALIGNPELLLIDEPTTGMDAASRQAFWEALGELRGQGRSVLLTTHYLEEAERAADRVLVLHGGQLLAGGTPEALRAQVGGARVSFRAGLTLAEVRALPGVRSAQVGEGGHTELHTDTPERLLAELVGRDVPFRDLEVRRATLEDAFLTLTATGHSSQTASPSPSPASPLSQGA